MTTNLISLAMQVMEELKPELRMAQTSPQSMLPSLREVLKELGPLPVSTLFLGMASDGLPVLLNLQNSRPGPLLILGDAGAGKTAFLQTVAGAMALRGPAQGIQFGVISNYPDEWEGFEKSPACAGVFPTYHDSATDFLLSLVGCAQEDRGSHVPLVLLLDDLESLSEADFEVQQSLRWLLQHGPERGIWPLATLNAGRSVRMLLWLEAFPLRVFGRVRQEKQVEVLTQSLESGLSSLLAGVQFMVCRENGWQRFWIPRHA
jgi:hypothetical protein